MQVVLVNPYELGRQPFGLAEPTAWLKQAGFSVDNLDLSVGRLDSDMLRHASLVAIYVPMHTATRIAAEAIPRVRELAPEATICVYGLYAPMNAELFENLGVDTVLGGEFEPALLSLAKRIRSADANATLGTVVNLAKIPFLIPDRAHLPSLAHYAHLRLADGIRKTVGFVETSRGCKHLCRHCPVVPIYQGKFRIVPVEVVLADIRNQVSAGAQHISFGDPDFLNGPTHAVRIVRAINRAFPELTYDATIKIQHILQQRSLLPVLKDTGCLFITSAVEAVDGEVLRYLDKNHTNEDFGLAVKLLNAAGIALAPTFVAFTPWTTLEMYIALLTRLVELRLVESVPPVQLTIRLLVPEGSYLLRLGGFRQLLDEFDGKLLGYRWQHADRRVDDLQLTLQDFVAKAESEERPRREIFEQVWRMTHASADISVPRLPQDLGYPIPSLSEPWYCCAEPTKQQLTAF